MCLNPSKRILEDCVLCIFVYFSESFYAVFMQRCGKAGFHVINLPIADQIKQLFLFA